MFIITMPIQKSAIYYRSFETDRRDARPQAGRNSEIFSQTLTIFVSAIFAIYAQVKLFCENCLSALSCGSSIFVSFPVRARV